MVSTRSNTAAAVHTSNPTTTVVSTAVAPPSYNSVVPANNTTAHAVEVANANGPSATGPATGPATSAINTGSTPPVYASREEYVNEAATKMENKLKEINDKDEQIEYLKTRLISQHGISIDLCLKHNQKAHRLVQAGRDIRARDLHLRMLRDKLLHQMDLQNRRLIAQTAQRISNSYSAKIDEWFSNNQIQPIVLRPEGQASRSRARITRSTTSRESRHGMMVQNLGTQVVDGKRVASRVNLEQQVIADLKAKLRNAEQYVEVLQHKYDVLTAVMPPPSYEAAKRAMGDGTA